MLHKKLKDFLKTAHYPKLFWEPAYENTVSLAYGKTRHPNQFFFYHKNNETSFYPALIESFSSGPLSVIGSLPCMIEKSHLPTFATWKNTVERALVNMKKGLLQKV